MDKGGDIDDPIEKAMREREIGAVIKIGKEKENKPEPKDMPNVAKSAQLPPKMHEAGKVPKYLHKYKAAAEE